jgi:hypothetical protein
MNQKKRAFGAEQKHGNDTVLKNARTNILIILIGIMLLHGV